MARRSRLVARREQLNLTQKALVALVGCSLDTYRGWENGRGNPRGYNRYKLEQALRGPNDEDIDIGDLLLRDDEREALTRSAMITADPELPDRIVTVRSGRMEIDTETIEGLILTTRGFRQLYGSAAAAMLLRPATGILDLLEGLAPDAGDDQQNVVISMIGQVSALVGTLYMLDIGDFPLARTYFARATQAARQAKNRELLAFALGCRAFHSAYSGHPGDGLAFAEAAVDVARRGIHPRTHGWLAAVASEMAATTGDADLYMSDVNEAASQLDVAAVESQPWLGIGVFNADKLAAYRGGGLVRLGQYKEAQAVLREALDRLDPVQKKHRATAHVDLAEAYVHGGQIDAGASEGSAALDIVAETGHDATLRRIETLHAEVKDDRTQAVRDLGQKLLVVRAGL